MRIVLAQLNPTVGDVAGNEAKVLDAIARAEQDGATLVVFSELTLTGYPPRDLLEDPKLIADNVAALSRIAPRCRDIAAMVGFAKPATESFGPGLEDAVALLAGGQIRQVFVKSLLPNYSVYDDPRYFRAGTGPGTFDLDGKRIGVTVCEDLWDATALGRDLYGMDPIGQLADEGVDLVINVSASGFQRGKIRQREDLIARQASRCNTPLLYVNQVGGNDEMVFDGNSCAYLPTGELLGRAASFREDLLPIDTEAGPGRCEPIADDTTRLADALKLGLRDYVEKGGFARVLVPVDAHAISFGLLALAVEALGPDGVRGVLLSHSNASSEGVDPRRLADVLGIRVLEAPADELDQPLEQTLRNASVDLEPHLLQAARVGIRGVIQTAVARGHGCLALTAVDKTDIALGLGSPADGMPGALAPLGDVLKSDVCRIVEWLATQKEITCPEWASAAPAHLSLPGIGEFDAGSVDRVISYYVEQGLPVDQIIAEGLDADPVHRVVRRINRTEHRRRQAPLALMVSSRAFGGGRRLPVARHHEDT